MAVVETEFSLDQVNEQAPAYRTDTRAYLEMARQETFDQEQGNRDFLKWMETKTGLLVPPDRKDPQPASQVPELEDQAEDLIRAERRSWGDHEPASGVPEVQGAQAPPPLEVLAASSPPALPAGFEDLFREIRALRAAVGTLSGQVQALEGRAAASGGPPPGPVTDPPASSRAEPPARVRAPAAEGPSGKPMRITREAVEARRQDPRLAPREGHTEPAEGASAAAAASLEPRPVGMPGPIDAPQPKEPRVTSRPGFQRTGKVLGAAAVLLVCAGLLLYQVGASRRPTAEMPKEALALRKAEAVGLYFREEEQALEDIIASAANHRLALQDLQGKIIQMDPKDPGRSALETEVDRESLRLVAEQTQVDRARRAQRTLQALRVLARLGS